MSLLYICINRWIAAVFLVLASASSVVSAQTIERAIMPGPVVQAHEKYEEECSKCHERFNRAGQQRLCAECHKEIGSDIQRKAHFHGHLENSTCAKCHTEHKGRNAKIIQFDKSSFNHDSTGLALKGAHKKLLKDKCASCHLPKTKYRDAPTQCAECHRKDDVHKGNLGKNCASCHGEDDWKKARFDHGKTRFKLDGGHEEVACKECHVNQQYKDTPRDCYGCHKEDDRQDGHKGRFNQKCDKCHTTATWEETTFDHTTDTQFRLKGKHEQAECTLCHTTTLFVPPKTPTRCVACHRKDDDKKGHKGSLGEKCDSCHNEQDWKKTSFNHDKTDYPLTGKHRDAKCESCHKGGLQPLPGETVRKKLPTDCATCHKKDDDDKGHKGKFGTKCETCHQTTDWKKSKFDHNLDTKYVLLGKHSATKCSSCHTGQLYVEKLSTECVSCHRKLDNEKGHRGQLGSRCNDCHNETKWTGVKFDHNRSRFPLTGLHALADCKKCHQTPAFKDAKRACIACHNKDDVHKRKLGIKCEQCHNTRSWKAWDFDHSTTRYRLEGAHAKARCDACHKQPMLSKPSISTSCIDCHADDDVHHGGFGGQCERCHDSTSWKRLRR